MLNRKGQSTLEYALIIAVVVGGLLLMQHYVRRGYAGRLKSSSDEMGEQYDPAKYTGNFTVTQHTRTQQDVNLADDKVTETKHLDPQTNIRSGSEKVTGWTEGEDLFSK